MQNNLAKEELLYTARKSKRSWKSLNTMLLKALGKVWNQESIVSTLDLDSEAELLKNKARRLRQEGKVEIKYTTF